MSSAVSNNNKSPRDQVPSRRCLWGVSLGAPVAAAIQIERVIVFDVEGDAGIMIGRIVSNNKKHGVSTLVPVEKGKRAGESTNQRRRRRR